jgi:hypothetical protein
MVHIHIGMEEIKDTHTNIDIMDIGTIEKDNVYIVVVLMCMYNRQLYMLHKDVAQIIE